MQYRKARIPLILKYEPELLKTMLLFEDGQKEYVDESSMMYIETMCLRHGSTMQGRRDAICASMKISQKAPILVSEGTRLMYFPLTSPQRHPDAVWVCYNRIRTCKNGTDGMSAVVYFEDGTSYVVQEQSRTVLKQCRKCAEYIKYLNEQEEELQGKMDLAQLRERLFL